MQTLLRAATFTPVEAEHVTGLSNESQRAWRSRGLLRRHEDLVLYGPLELAQMFVAAMLAARGIGPQRTQEIVPFCGQAVLWHALALREAYAGNPQQVLCWEPDLFAGIVQTKTRLDDAAAVFMAPPTDENRRALLTVSGPSWRDQAAWLRSRVWEEFALSNLIAHRFAVWWPDGSAGFHASVDAAYDALPSSDARAAGPVITLDQHALASALVQRIPRPLVHAQIGDPASPENRRPIRAQLKKEQTA